VLLLFNFEELEAIKEKEAILALDRSIDL
jgi:hypothetical protein